MSRKRVAGFAVLAMLPASALAQQWPTRVVARSGDFLPITPPIIGSGVAYSTFGTPIIAPRGWMVAFNATLIGGGTTAANDEIYVRYHNFADRVTVPLAREGFAVGSFEEATFLGGISGVRINNHARTAFLGYSRDVNNGNVRRTLTNGWGDHEGLYCMTCIGAQIFHPPGTANITALRHYPAVGPGEYAVALVVDCDMDTPFHVGSGSALMTASSAGNYLLIRHFTGEQAVGAPSGVVFDSLVRSSPRITTDDAVFFEATLAGPGVTPANNVGIWRLDDDTFETHLVFRGGTPFSQFTFIGNPTLTSVARSETGAHHVTFLAPFTGILQNPESDDALWLISGEQRRLVAREGANVPGLPDVQFSWFSNEARVNAHGHVAFAAGLKGLAHPGNDTSIWLDAGGELQLVVRELDIVPGSSTTTIGQLFGCAFNNADQIVFFANLVGIDVTPANDHALFAWTPEHGLMLVAREGDSFDIPELGAKTLHNFTFQMGACEDGHATGLTNDGTIVYRAVFTDGTEAVLLTTIPPPPPACAADFNADGVLNSADFFDFLTAFFAQGAPADVNTDGDVNSQDFFDFLATFFAGC